MEEKILLTTNSDQVAEFERSLKDVIMQSNELITQWNQFQEWDVITTQSQAIELIKDPIGRLDKFLISAVDIKVIGKAKLNPSIIADMLNIPYDSWVNIIEGREPKTDCIPCRKMKLKKGKQAISFQDFQQYEKFLTWQNNTFVAAEEAVKEKQESAKVYITDPEQVALHSYFHDACDTLNSLFERAYIGTDTLIAFSKQIQNRLTYSYGDNRLHVNEPLLMAEIFKLQ